MRMHGWRLVAAMALSVSVAACDDTTGGGEDMAMPGDMAVSMEDGATPDLTMVAAPGTGRVLLADVQGTVYIPSPADADAGITAGNLHLLSTLTSFPENVTAPPDFFFGLSNTSTDIPALTLYGCFGDRYDLTGADRPAADVNVGTVTMTGFDTPPSQSGMTVGIPPNLIACQIPQGFMNYGCAYAPSDGGTAFLGTQTTQVVSTGEFIATGGTTDIVINVPGGGSYTTMPQTASIMNVKPGVTVIGVKNGAAPAAVALDVVGPLVAANDLTVTWSCDGNNTPGGGCPADLTDVLLISITTSGKPRHQFAPPGPTNLKFGSMVCLTSTGRTAAAPDGSPAGTFKVPAMGISAILGATAADNRSYQLAVIRAKLNLATSANGAHAMLYAAGKGNFGFNDQ